MNFSGRYVMFRLRHIAKLGWFWWYGISSWNTDWFSFQALCCWRRRGGGWNILLDVVTRPFVSLWCLLHKDVVVLHSVIQNLHTALSHAPEREFLPYKTVINSCFMWDRDNISVLVHLPRIRACGLCIYRINFDGIFRHLEKRLGRGNPLQYLLLNTKP